MIKVAQNSRELPVEHSTLKEADVMSRPTPQQSGQALAETAIVFVLVLLLLGGLVEFVWAYFRYLAMQDAAGEGAAYGMVFPTYWHGDDQNAVNFNCDPNNIVYRVKNESQSDILDWQAADVQVSSFFASPSPGQAITVTVSYDHQLITPLISEYVGDGSLTLRARAVQTVLAPPSAPDPVAYPGPCP